MMVMSLETTNAVSTKKFNETCCRAILSFLPNEKYLNNPSRSICHHVKPVLPKPTLNIGPNIKQSDLSHCSLNKALIWNTRDLSSVLKSQADVLLPLDQKLEGSQPLISRKMPASSEFFQDTLHHTACCFDKKTDAFSSYNSADTTIPLQLPTSRA